MLQTKSDFLDLCKIFEVKSVKDLLPELQKYLESVENEATQKDIAGKTLDYFYKRFFASANAVLLKHKIKNREKILQEIQEEFIKPFIQKVK